MKYRSEAEGGNRYWISYRVDTMLGRPWLLRLSVGGNLIVFLYLALYSTSNTSPYPGASSSQQSPTSSNYVSKDINYGGDGGGGHSGVQQQQSSVVAITQGETRLGGDGGQKMEVLDENGVPMAVAQDSMIPSQSQQIVVADDAAEIDSNDNTNNNNNNNVVGGGGVGNGDDLGGAGRGMEGDRNREILLNDSNAMMGDGNGYNRFGRIDREKLFACDDVNPRSYFGQRGPFWVLYNYIVPSRKFGCDEAVTYSTHGDFTFLDNLVPLLERWEGPLSLSLYAPGKDFHETLLRIQYLLECSGTSIVREYVHFHIFFDHKNIPKNFTMTPDKIFAKNPMNCSQAKTTIPWGEGMSTFKKQAKLPYPVNVARNVAREMAPTHYVLASDIELYPSPNLIPNFLDMIRRNDSELQRPKPKLYVLPIFEVEANVTKLPYNKEELQGLLKTKMAIPFHKYICSGCHRIPKQAEWEKSKPKPGLHVFHIGKRHKPYHHWEPIYIGTKSDPTYDERLTWEGRSDKMTQGYVLCVLDYEFHILDTAFLVHRPGVKRKLTNAVKSVVARQNSVIQKFILPELILLYGKRPGCYI